VAADDQPISCGVAVTTPRLAYRFHFDDRVRGIGQGTKAGAVAEGLWAMGGHARRQFRGDRVELANVTEGVRLQRRTYRWGPRTVEDPTRSRPCHWRHVIDAAGAGAHPDDRGGGLEPGVRPRHPRH
jgi:hypothetical protein